MRFNILMDGETVAVVEAPGPREEATSIKLSDEDGVLSYYLSSHVRQSMVGSGNYTPAQLARLLGGQGQGSYEEVSDDE